MSAERLTRITEVLDKYIAEDVIVGSVSLVYRRGEIAYLEMRGYQDREARMPMKRDTIFALASMTKPVTAAAMMILVEEGNIRLDDPVDKFLPELANRHVLNRPNGPLSDTHPSPRPITLRDVLTNRVGIGQLSASGISADAPISKAFEAADGDAMSGASTADGWLKALGALPLVFDPGYQFMYQTPSVLLGILIERVSGQPLAKFMEERLFEPLRMRDTGFWVPEEKWSRLATTYQAGSNPGTLVPVEKGTLGQRLGGLTFFKAPVFPNGGGGLVATVDDYLRFARMMLHGGKVDGIRILSHTSIELMTRDHMTPEQHELPWALPGWWNQQGFGFGVQVRTQQLHIGPSPGSFHWDGATGVHWTADPKEDLILLRMNQRLGLIPGGVFDQDFDTAVYQAIAD